MSTFLKTKNGLNYIKKNDAEIPYRKNCNSVKEKTHFNFCNLDVLVELNKKKIYKQYKIKHVQYPISWCSENKKLLNFFVVLIINTRL